MDHSFEFDDSDDEDDGCEPWALGDDEHESPERGDDDDGPSAADHWLDEQLGQQRSARLDADDARKDAGLSAVAAWLAAGLEERGDAPEPMDDGPVLPAPPGPRDAVVLRHPASARTAQRRRADPDAVADLPRVAVAGYRRDRRGTWRYSATGAAVPGARDLTLRSLHRFDVARGHVHVPVELVRTGAELAWCMAWKHTLTTRLGGGHVEVVLRVPVDEWERRADIPFGLWAPELTPARLLGVADVARIARVTPATITAYLARRRMPPPVARIGNSPVWSRPVIRHWLASRPGQGARSRP
jgi:hypothetical protein